MKTLVDRIPTLADPDDGYFAESIKDAANAIETIADDIEGKVVELPNNLKKVFKNATPEQIEDYAAIVSLCCGWLRGISAEAEDYAGEEDGKMLISMCVELPEWGDSIKDNIFNMDYDWKSIQDGEDKYDMTQEVLDNWNAVCKALVGKTWD